MGWWKTSWFTRVRRMAPAAALAALAAMVGCRDDVSPARVAGPGDVGRVVSGPPNQQDWRHCENGKDPASACGWITGNLNATQNVYYEGWYVPHVLRIPDIVDAAPDTLVMTYGFKKGGHHTFDFLGVWNASLPNANVCTESRYADFCTGPVNPSTPPAMRAVSASTPAGSLAAALVAAASACGSPFADSLATAITRAEASGPAIALRGIDLAAISIAGASLDGCGADVEATIRIVMTPKPGVTSALLLIGAHIARTRDWMGGGATMVPGSPYHLGLISINGISTGSMDLQLQSNAIQTMGRVMLIKQTLGDVGSFDFTRTDGEAPNPIPATFTMSTGTPGSASSGVDTLLYEDVPLGTQVITESAPATGWALTGLSCVDPSGNSTVSLESRAATIVVDDSELIVCTFTNTASGGIRVVKTAVGGDSTFLFTPVGFGGGAFALTTVSGTSDTTFTQLTAASAESGTYRLSESPLAGWDAGTFVCRRQGDSTSAGDPATGITVVAGETTTCRITNTKRGAIRVVKTAVGGDSTFTFTPIGFGDGPFGLTTVSGTQDTTFAGLIPARSVSGTYRLTEMALPGWEAGAFSCTRADGTTSAGDPATGITVAAGETTTCAITNDKWGRLVVRKVMVGDTGTFVFSEDVVGSIATNTGTLSQDVAPGTYHVTEDSTPGWYLTALSCDAVASGGDLAARRATYVVAPGQVVTCTFTNTRLVGGPTRTLGFWSQHQDLVQAFIFGPTGTSPAGYTLAVPVSVLLPASVTQCAAPSTRFWDSEYYLGGLNANVARTSTGARRGAIDQARMQLMRQLLAAVLNSVAFGTVPSGAAGYASAFAAYCGADRAAMLAAANALALFNEGGDAMPWTIGPQGPAQNKIVTTAMVSLWDVLP